MSGAAANFPDGFDRELDPMQVALRTPGAAAEYTVATPVHAARHDARAVFSADTLATMGSVNGLVVAGRSYPLDVWVTIAGANTAEGAQTVRASTTYVAGPGPIALSIVLPATTWTPTGAGPIDFTLALPNASAAAGSYAPYGSAVFALGTERDAALLDCAPAAIRIADASIPWSDSGRAGSAGRYAFEPNLDRPVIATAVSSAAAASRLPRMTGNRSRHAVPTTTAAPPATPRPAAGDSRRPAGRSPRPG